MFYQIFVRKLLPYHRQMVISRSQHLFSSPETPSTIHAVIQFSNKNIYFWSQLFENGRIISVNLKDKYELRNDMFFQWSQLKHTIPTRWKTLTSNYSDIDQKNLCQNHVIRGARILSTGKLSPMEMYSFLISNIVNKTTSNIYFQKLFENITLDWI